MNKDNRTLAFINLYAILGTVPKLLELDAEAAALCKGKKVSIGFKVKGGPSGTLAFGDGKCSFYSGLKGAQVVLPFSSPEKFNALIDGEYTPIPSKGFTKISFLLKSFTKITDILTKYLRAEKKDLENEEFFTKSTLLMFNVIAGAIAQIANEDRVGQASASYIEDGVIKMAIGNDAAIALEAKEHKLTVLDRVPEDFRAYMVFDNMKLARQLFDGEVNSVAEVGVGNIRIGGFISMIDNVNRILGRVALYLA